MNVSESCKKIIFEQVIVSNKKVAIFGAGSLAERFIADNVWIYEHIECFIDNYPKADLFLKKPLVSFEAFKLKDQSAYFIIVASSYYKEICAQLDSEQAKRNIDYVQIYDIEPNEASTDSQVVSGVKIGKFTYGYAHHCYTNSLLEEVGAFTSINESVRIGEVNHPLDFITTHPILYVPENEILGYEGVSGIFSKEQVINIYESSKNKKIKIGNDVWIGAGAMILPGVTIGDGAVIGAGTIVTKDVPPYAIVVGVPSKVIRYRFTEDQIQQLLIIKWWEWENEKIKENATFLSSPELFLQKFGSDKESL